MLCGFVLSLLLFAPMSSNADGAPAYTRTAFGMAENDRSTAARERVAPKLRHLFGCPVFLRAYKEEEELELWVQQGGRWHLQHTYPISAQSGDLGPKTAEGDEQVPEGFYAVTPRGMNPCSSYHLSFNIGYPNAYDTSLGRTGSLIMIHGKECSVGCLAMGDAAIEEIYTLVAESLRAEPARAVPVHLFPFRLTPQRMAEEQDSPHADFWRYLAEEATHRTPQGIPLPTAGAEVQEQR